MKWREFETKTLTPPNTFENWLLRRLSAYLFGNEFPVGGGSFAASKVSTELQQQTMVIN